MTRFEFETGGRALEVGCYGSGSDWLCRLSDASANQDGHSEAYKTQPDLGYVWMRFSPQQGLWLASCMVQEAAFPEADALRRLMEEVMHRAVRDDWQLNWVIEFVQANRKATFDGEEGYLEWGRR